MSDQLTDAHYDWAAKFCSVPDLKGDGASADQSGAPATDQSSAPAADQSGAPAADQSSAPAADQSGAPAADQSSAPAADQSSPPPTDQSGAPASSTSQSVEASADVGGDSPVRPSQIVAGASGVQYSTGENTDQADNSGKDFADGSRDAAQADQHDPAFGESGSNAMQSPDLANGKFALRYGIGFLCDTYPAGWNNLADIAEYSKPNSAYLKAFGGMNKTQQYKNPKKADIVQQVSAWIATLGKDLPSSGQGELVMSFQGHGAHGSFFASDGGELKTAELMGMAKQAEAARVSLTIVMDACFSGGAVPDFQDHSADAVDKAVDKNVEGKGQVSSVENHANAEHLRDQMAHARELIRDSAAIAGHGDTLNGLIQQIEATNTTNDWDAAMAENTRIVKLIRQMQAQFETNMNFGNIQQDLLNQIDGSFTTALNFLGGIKPFTSFDYNTWTGAIGHFQDQVSDSANKIIVSLNAQGAAS